jgi:hypothetical protein
MCSLSCDFLGFFFGGLRKPLPNIYRNMRNDENACKLISLENLWKHDENAWKHEE